MLNEPGHSSKFALPGVGPWAGRSTAPPVVTRNVTRGGYVSI